MGCTRSKKHNHPLLGIGKQCYRCDVNRVEGDKVDLPADSIKIAVVLQKCQFSCTRMKKKSHLKLNTNVGRGLELYFIMRRIRREEIFKRGQKVIGKKSKKSKVGFQ